MQFYQTQLICIQPTSHMCPSLPSLSLGANSMSDITLFFCPFRSQNSSSPSPGVQGPQPQESSRTSQHGMEIMRSLWDSSRAAMAQDCVGMAASPPRATGAAPPEDECAGAPAMPLHVPVPSASHTQALSPAGSAPEQLSPARGCRHSHHNSQSHYSAPCCSSCRLFDSRLLFSHLESLWPLGCLCRWLWLLDLSSGCVWHLVPWDTQTAKAGEDSAPS